MKIKKTLGTNCKSIKDNEIWMEYGTDQFHTSDNKEFVYKKLTFMLIDYLRELITMSSISYTYNLTNDTCDIKVVYDNGYKEIYHNIPQ